MNPTIKRELEKIRAPIDYDDNTTHIHIPKKEEAPKGPGWEIGRYYLLELEDYILHEPPNFTLSANWNKGIVPKDKIVRGQLIQTMGSMLQFNAAGYDALTDQLTQNYYIGLWVPNAGVKIHKVL